MPYIDKISCESFVQATNLPRSGELGIGVSAEAQAGNWELGEVLSFIEVD